MNTPENRDHLLLLQDTLMMLEMHLPLIWSTSDIATTEDLLPLSLPLPLPLLPNTSEREMLMV
jgi:hypothetical protein